MGSGDTSANDTASAAENATAGESGGAMDGADGSAQEAEAAAPTVTVDGIFGAAPKLPSTLTAASAL